MKKWMQCLMAVILIAGTSALSSCSIDHDDNPVTPEPEGYKGVPLVILDTDIGSSTDDLFALEMLYHYADEGRCKLLGIVVDRQGEDNVAMVDVMNTYYGYSHVPVGVERNGILNPAVFIDYGRLYKYEISEGDALFSLSERGIVTLTDQFGTAFMPLPTGNARYQKPGSETWCHEMLERIRKACIGNH